MSPSYCATPKSLPINSQIHFHPHLQRPTPQRKKKQKINKKKSPPYCSSPLSSSTSSAPPTKCKLPVHSTTPSPPSSSTKLLIFSTASSMLAQTHLSAPSTPESSAPHSCSNALCTVR